jgi:hypothetical protein
MFCVVENIRRQHLDWLSFVLDNKGWDQAELSRRTGRDPSTFSKFINDPENKAQLSPATVRLIEKVSGLKAFETSVPVKPRGLAEHESSPYDAAPLTVLNDAINALKGGRPGVDAWVLHSRAVEAAGYIPGDVLVVDQAAKAEPGDVVCEQVYDRSGTAETVFRIFEDPFLIAASFNVSLLKPLLVDNDRVAIRGVVVASFRERRAAA